MTSKNAFSIRQHIEYRINFGPKEWLRLMRVINIYDRYTALYLSLLHINALSSSFDDHQVHSGNNCHIIRIFYTEDLAGYLSFISKPKDINLLSALMKSISNQGISTLRSYHQLGNWKTFYYLIIFRFHCDF